MEAYGYITTYDTDDALLNPARVMRIYISRQVSDMALQMLHMVPSHALLFHVMRIHFHRVHNMTCNRHLRSHSEGELCNCHVPRESVFVCNASRGSLSVDCVTATCPQASTCEITISIFISFFTNPTGII